MRSSWLLRPISTLLLTALASSGLSLAAQDLSPAGLERQAIGILQTQCLGCHGATSKMGGLVLDRREAALRGGTSGPALMPGTSGASLLLQKVKAGQMPPGNPLPAADRDLLTRWIDAGAPWTATLAERKRAGKNWWSLQPIQPLTGTIDGFLQEALAAKGLTSSPPASKGTLLRRATFDLTGLPPTPEETKAFLADTSDDAYERLVERLLASPAYGERWGRHWLDVIRFGESHGYEQNHLRLNAWPFRDYIIRSFNQDKPFDRLMLEHLAGDVVAPGDPEVEIGTGFLVAGPHDTVTNLNEAAARQQRADDLDDMINATSSAFLGLTVSCARCHDHKFDPIEQRDYYRLAALLNGVVHDQRAIATNADREKVRNARAPLEDEHRQLNEKLNQLRLAAKPAIEEQRAAILARYRPAVDTRLTEERFAPVTARWVRLSIQRTSNGSGAGLEEFEVWSRERNVALASTGAKARASSIKRPDDDPNAYSESYLNDGQFDRRWFAKNGEPANITIELAALTLVDRVSWSRDRAGGFQKRFEGAPVSLYTVEVSTDGVKWTRVASSEGRLPFTEREREELLLLAVVTPAVQAEYQATEQRRVQVEKQLAALPKLPLVYAGRLEQPKQPIHLLQRGNVMDRGEQIVPATLSTLSFSRLTIDEAQPESERRLALARWLGDPRNPLTPRVLANRVWHYHFGRGLVATPSDFGYNGERPSHPKLLDYLAGRLLAYGWQLKPLHREIMLSAAYRQSSAHDEAKARVDGESRLLWRFPPQRLSAEAIRDTILSVTGKLDRRMGGPGFHLFRYTVDNVATYLPLDKFTADTYRRAVYQTAARSVRSELLGQYDCPDSSLPEPKRIVTTSPLQALALLNNAFLLDQARFLAERLQREAGPDRTRQVELAFALAFSRQPTPQELQAAQQLIQQHGLTAFSRALLNANELIYLM